jgi:hypothetical protein
MPLAITMITERIVRPTLGEFRTGVPDEEGVAFRHPPFEREADSLTFILTEIVKHRLPRNTRDEWVPIFYLLGRLITLFLIAAPAGGNGVSTRFSSNLDAVLSSKECKLDFDALVADAISAEKTNGITSTGNPKQEQLVPMSAVEGFVEQVKKLVVQRGRGRGAAPRR